MTSRVLALLVGLLSLAGAPPASAADRTPLACSLCDGLAARMSGAPDQPFVLRSFEPAGAGTPLPPTLENTGYVYDNALALMALYGCGRAAEAERIADALLLALNHDRHYRDGRLRNAYRAGPVTLAPDGIMLPGFWSAERNAWTEDAYNVGTATGSTAWGALALLAAHAETGSPAYLDGARRIMTFVGTTRDARNPGYFGGYFGFEPRPDRLAWKSTEHNLDVYAAARWLAALDPAGQWTPHADHAKSFLDAMWDAQGGHFHIGTIPGGNAPNTASSGLDAQLWPLLAVDAFRAKAPQILAWTEAHHGLPGGFDFDTDRDGIWLEGTAQAALTYRWLGEPQKAEPLFATLEAQISPERLVYAASIDRVTTGLQVGPTPAQGDFLYRRLPHVGATAWTILAALDLNPFRPESVRKTPPACAPP